MTARPVLTEVAVCCRAASGADDRAEHHRIRNTVFVTEQRIFAESDVDAHDARADVVHVLGLVGGVPAGAVRLFPLGDAGGDWQGDRLAVAPEFRASGLGAPLVRFAVATAARLGGQRMIAHVQPANERFFLRLGWARRGGPETYVGHPHLLMDIDLDSAMSRMTQT